MARGAYVRACVRTLQKLYEVCLVCPDKKYRAARTLDRPRSAQQMTAHLSSRAAGTFNGEEEVPSPSAVVVVPGVLFVKASQGSTH